MIEQLQQYAMDGWEIAKAWLLSPAAWSQFGLLVAAYVAAVLVNKHVTPQVERILTPKDDDTSIIAKARRFVLMFLPLVLPLAAYAFTAIGESVTRSLFGSGAVIAFGKRVFLFLAIRAFARDMLSDPFLRFLGRYVLIPAGAAYALGLWPFVTEKLESTVVPLGNLSFDLWWLSKFIVVGGIIFWFGRWSNEQSTQILKQQEDMRPATRQLAIKAAEIAIFGAAFLVLMNIMGVSLTSLAVLGGAVGVGIGFGLQQIASNFISGIILLLEGQATVGDYVELDGGEAGTIVKMTMRVTILETFDGRWIVVPNEHFITTRVVNYSDQGSANRYEVEFSVSYDTDINKVPDIIEAAVAKHPAVLTEPDAPDCELRGFGDSGIDFAIEFWVNGIDDGRNKYTSQIRFIVWNALKDAGIEIPYPHRVVEFRGAVPDMPKTS
ncbi:mechanosensitive ion channel family protein [Marivivens marinus]|uniref:mechanosensitive ion channel family protein n=1 Tax=Marivivens marinus TaxID=3110173 RepID=UPI003B8484CA